MTWFQTIFNFLALSLLRLFAFLPYALVVPIGYGLGWLAAHPQNPKTPYIWILNLILKMESSAQFRVAKQVQDLA